MKKRIPAVALLFSIIAPGLGQIYNGQCKKGILFYAVGLAILLSYSVAGLYFYGYIFYLIISVGWLIFVLVDAAVTAGRLKQLELHNYHKWYIYLTIALIFHFVTFGVKGSFVGIKAYSFPSGSMRETLQKGDWLQVNKFAYGVRNPFTNKVWLTAGKPRRNDLAVFIFPQDPGKDYIKRVIGLPGDRVQIIDKKVFINDQLLKTPQAIFEDAAIIPGSKVARDNFGPAMVPRNSYFVLGDNRDQSYDSRFWGFVPFDLVRGQVLYVYFSWDRENSRVRWERIGRSLN